MTADGRPVATLPVARVLPLLQPAHLDREFDYLVPEKWDEAARPGVRVRIRFAGRLVDGFVTERRAASDHTGTLAPIERVISDLVVLPEEQRRLVDAVAHRYGGTRAEVLRLAIPPRHARAEDSVRARLAETAEKVAADSSAPPPVPTAGWDRYVHGGAFLAALAAGRAPRAVWQTLPGDDPAARLAEAAAACVAAGRAAVLIVPDARVLARVEAACTALLGADRVTALAAELGPSARYRRWLLGLTGLARVVVGTRAAVFAPVIAPGLIAVWDDGDDNLAEPRAPYPHAREVAVLRAHHSGAGLLLAGHTRTAEAQQLVEHGWAHDLLADRVTVRAAAPHIRAAGDSEPALERDPLARAARIPAVAFAAARRALAAGAPVLVQVPRAGYLPVIACAGCKEPARCRHCAGPLGLPGPGQTGASPDGADEGTYPTCRWCGRTERTHRCGRCGSRAVRASVVGAGRTAEELGRAFSGTPVVYSGGDHVRDEVPAEPAVVVSTVGAEPQAVGGYGAALLLDGWMLLTRPDLRAGEQALRRWAAAAALVRAADDGGEVVITAEPGAPTVQALIRWDPVGHARAELAGRGEVGFPPAVHIAAVDGAASVIADFVDTLALPEGAEVLGPVPLPPGERGPAGSGEVDEPIDRILLRVPRTAGRALAEAVHTGLAQRSAKRIPGTVRVQIDPLRVG